MGFRTKKLQISVTILKWDYLTAYIVKILITPRKIFKKFFLSFFKNKANLLYLLINTF